MKNLIYTTLVLFTLYIAGTTGCGKKDDKQDVKTDANQKTEDVKKQDVKTDVKTKNSDTPPKLPADFPEDIPLYKDFKILSNMKNSAVTEVSILIDDKAPAVGNFYKTEMPKNGYKADSHNDKMMHDDGGILTFTKDGKEYSIGYHFNEIKGKTDVSITMMNK